MAGAGGGGAGPAHVELGGLGGEGAGAPLRGAGAAGAGGGAGSSSAPEWARAREQLPDFRDKWERLADYAAVKIEALLWVGAALFIFFYGDGRDNLLDLALHDEMVNRTWLYVGLGAAAVNGAIFLYLAVWLSWWQGKREWFREAPYAVPAGTVCGIVTAFSAIVAFWPVLTWRAPVYAGVLFMGFLMHFHFHPSFGGGPPKED